MPYQTTFTLDSRGKGFHLITEEVQRALQSGLKGCSIGYDLALWV